MKQLTLSIQGMSCDHCLHAVTDALRASPGVQLESVQLGRATLGYDEQVTDPGRIEAAVADAGYPATAQAPRESAS